MNMDKEIWKPIEGFEYYEVSNLGRVRSLSHIDSMGRLKEGKILTQNFDGKKNYLHVGMGKGTGRRYTKNVHRLVAKAFIPNPNNFKEINHKDEKKTNNAVTNLEWCDHTYNSNYGSKPGSVRGDKNPQNKFSYEDVVFIKKHHIACGGRYTNKDLALMFGISPTHVCAIAHGRRWKHVNPM
jgi:hypothetical protein